ncbi:sensor histidine kinase [Nitratifractor salsuginis]|uniref:histidine kinase n=1 Tax=Nitratifractor salsuginis (strain DSM 16511 / JCM 12458 / E9I37-1) TaxID=749222 RepID=E6X396_NITSE|nr:ATP-binding protein [Nitratifractor salsuginis]ADV47309.1 integral membrane sensor signal transduction histidine kinase [Nitratifractor salsuginis DSM 16511]
MLKLSQLFFRRSALILTVTFILAALTGYYLLRQMEIDTHARMLRNSLTILEQELQTLPPAKIPATLRTIHQKTGIRITVIAPDGKVLFESNRSPVGMENHATRPEILQAKKSGWGEAVRHSATLDEDLLYIAHREGDSYLRTAYSLERIHRQLLQLWLKALGFFALILLLILALSLRLNRRIQGDSDRLRRSLEQLLEKNYDAEIDTVECCKEFAQIRKMLRKVSKKLAKRERQKAKYTKKLKTLTRRQSDIISAISHEFKNPVAAIMGYAQTLRESRNLDPQIRERFLEKIHSNAEKISAMIDRLSLAIRLENRGFTPKRNRFPLSQVISSVRETLLQKYPGREIVLECEPVELEADRDMIEQAVMNLIENALKYSADKVIVRCDAEKLEVIDRGEGIEPGDLEKITKKFYRVDRLSWNNSIGVGLYIVKYILRLHGTELEIRSVPGEGSVFGFSLRGMKERNEKLETRN